MNHKLIAEIRRMKVIDTHEHIPHEKDFQDRAFDIFDFFEPYICDNLCSAGVTAELWAGFTDKRIPVAERMSAAFPFIESIRYTTYFRGLEQAARSLEIPYEFTEAGLVRAGEALSAFNTPGKIYDRLGIESGLTFMGYSGCEYFADSKYFRMVPTVSQITPRSASELAELGRVTGIEIRSLSDLNEAIEILFRGYERNGVRNIKIGSSYARVPDYDFPDETAAAAQLERLRSGELTLEYVNGILLRNCDITPIRELDNFVITRCAALAEKLHMNIILHTGIHAWNNNRLDAVTPKSFEKLIRAFDKTRIVLLHLGYPYTSEAILLARYYPHVFLDLAWLNLLEEAAAVRAVREIIEALPIHKICAFGGDCVQPVNVVGAYELTVKHLAAAFSSLTEEQILPYDEATRIIGAWLYANPKRIYGL